MRRFAVVVLAVTALAGPALAQAAMGAAEARRTFFGIDMEGVHQPSGQRWRECIDRTGKTAYRFGGSIDEGRLAVRADGALCFAYASRGYADTACWWIKPAGRGNYRFENADGESGVFVTTATHRTNSCEARDQPMS
jgi:hypothetical protein